MAAEPSGAVELECRPQLCPVGREVFVGFYFTLQH